MAVERAGQAVHITGEPLASGTDTATIVHFCAAVGVDVTVVIVKLLFGDGNPFFRPTDVDVVLVFIVIHFCVLSAECGGTKDTEKA